MEFEWSDLSAVRNLARYGVRFTEAIYSFLDPRAIEFEDERHGTLSLIGSAPAGLLYLVFSEPVAGRIHLLHARLADSRPAALEPEFEFDTRRIKRVPRLARHQAIQADMSPRRCHVLLSCELDADVVAALRGRSINDTLRHLLDRTASIPEPSLNPADALLSRPLTHHILVKHRQ